MNLLIPVFLSLVVPIVLAGGLLYFTFRLARWAGRKWRRPPMVRP